MRLFGEGGLVNAGILSSVFQYLIKSDDLIL